PDRGSIPDVAVDAGGSAVELVPLHRRGGITIPDSGYDARLIRETELPTMLERDDSARGVRPVSVPGGLRPVGRHDPAPPGAETERAVTAGVVVGEDAGQVVGPHPVPFPAEVTAPHHDLGPVVGEQPDHSCDAL